MPRQHYNSTTSLQCKDHKPFLSLPVTNNDIHNMLFCLTNWYSCGSVFHHQSYIFEFSASADGLSSLSLCLSSFVQTALSSESFTCSPSYCCHNWKRIDFSFYGLAFQSEFTFIITLNWFLHPLVICKGLFKLKYLSFRWWKRLKIYSLFRGLTMTIFCFWA